MRYPEDFINKVICGDCLEVMKEFPAECIDLTVTSPPYGELRDYKGYIFNFEEIAKELYRVMKDGGVIVWVVGDETKDGSESGTSFRQSLYFKELGFNLHDTMIYEKDSSPYPASRGGNRYTQIFEYMFVFGKGKLNTHNLICDKPNRWAGSSSWGQRVERQKDGTLKPVEQVIVAEFGVRNNIWRYDTGKGYTTKDDIAFEHPAIFPDMLARDHILTWSKKGDVVLDPLCGSGTTLVMAKYLERKYIGIDISQEYVELSKKRLGQYLL